MMTKLKDAALNIGGFVVSMGLVVMLAWIVFFAMVRDELESR